MNCLRPLATSLLLLIIATGCKKDKKDKEETLDVLPPCYKQSPVYRELKDKRATVKVTATAIGTYLVEEGSIDTKLITCDLPLEFQKNNLEVIINGGVHDMPPVSNFPCCIQSLDITSIRKP